MTNNNDWNTEDWDGIPEDVECVGTFGVEEPSYYKVVDGILQVQCYRSDRYVDSGYKTIESAIEYFGDRFHLRPSPITKPTLVTPESTQVDSSEVETTTTPEFDWSTVDWDEIPEDVEAVVTFKDDEPSYYKVVDGRIQVQCYRSNSFSDSGFDSIGRAIEYFGDRSHLRPTPITQPTRTAESTAVATLEQLGYEWEGGEFWKPPLGKKPDFTTPSILTILQEAQQSILKHHGVTGKVKFTVTCS